SYLDLTPALEMNRTGFLPTIFDYNQAKVVRAWTQFVQSTETETSRRRRRHGQALKTVSGRASLEPTDHSGETLTSIPLDLNERKAALSKAFSNRIRDAILNTIGQRTPDTSSERYTGPSTDSTYVTLLKRADPLPKESELPLNVSSFRYDLVDVTREIMAAIVIPGLHHELVDAYKAKDLARTRYWGRLILEAIKDTDRILGTHTHFMLGPWIRDARLAAKTASSSTSSRYQNYVEHSARNQITWWVPAGQQGLADYAGKQWSGLVKEFYYPRWKIFVDRLVTAAQKGRQLDYKAYLADSLKVESVWLKQTTCLGSSHGSRCSSKHTFALEPVEDTVIVAQDLWDRWNKIAARLAEKADKKA
ncbi:hypothetical protein BGZ54_004302, partial [Gamsiella multidivaricata]